MEIGEAGRNRVPETAVAAARHSSWSMPQHARRRQGTRNVLAGAECASGSASHDPAVTS